MIVARDEPVKASLCLARSEPAWGTAADAGQSPSLAKRELNVVRGVLEGRTDVEIAEMLGTRPASVVTYKKRAYQRLGISSPRQLFALCLSSEKV